MRKYAYLLMLLSFLLYNCNSDDDIQEVKLSCETQNLGIDERSKFSLLAYDSNNVIDEFVSKRWHWRIENDTIEVGGYLDMYGGSQHFFFKKNQINCIDLIFVRNVFYDDVIYIDIETQELISGGYTWTDLCDLDVTIQEYIEDERIVIKITNEMIGFDKTLWIDFTMDVYRPIPFDYETSGFIDPNGPHGGC